MNERYFEKEREYGVSEIRGIKTIDNSLYELFDVEDEAWEKIDTTKNVLIDSYDNGKDKYIVIPRSAIVKTYETLDDLWEEDI